MTEAGGWRNGDSMVNSMDVRGRLSRLTRFRLLVGGYGVSSYGSFLNSIALNLFVYTLTNSALALGLYLAVRLLSGFLAGLRAGGLIGRFGAGPIMLHSNLAQAAALAVLLLAPHRMQIEAVFLLAVVAGMGGTLFTVAFRGAVPDLVGAQRRAWANSLMVTGRSLGMVAGFGSSGLVIAAFFVSGIVLQYGFGRVVDRLGSGPVLRVGLLVFAVGGLSLALPLSPAMSDEDAERVVDAVRSVIPV